MQPEIKASLDSIRAAIQGVTQFDVDDVPHVAVPAGFSIQSMESLLYQPRSIKRDVQAHDLSGLIDYTNIFKDSRTRIFCGSAEAPLIESRLDYHLPDQPGHVSHCAAFPCPTTTEWRTWIGKNKTNMDQLDFADFVESNLADIVTPAGAELLTAALNFRDSGTADFRSAARLSDGRVQFKFVEEAKNEAGDVKFPETIGLALPVFEGGGSRYAIAGKLRYRIKDMRLVLWYELDRPDLVLRAAYADLLAKDEDATGIKVIKAL